jgi:hypothetical protein
MGGPEEQQRIEEKGTHEQLSYAICGKKNGSYKLQQYLLT